MYQFKLKPQVSTLVVMMIIIFSQFAKAAKYLYKATECAGDPSVAYNGLLKCVPSTELPEVCRQYLQRVP